MKKQLTVILLSALLLSGCASGRMGNPGAIMAGASIGGSLGSSIGGLIGDNNHGWRGGYRGSAIGNIVGTIAGAAIGNALTAPRQEQIEFMKRTVSIIIFTFCPVGCLHQYGIFGRIGHVPLLVVYLPFHTYLMRG